MIATLPLLAASLLAPAISADEGQGPADPDAKVEQLGFGQIVLGPAVDAAALRGKVVLVVFGGS